MRKQEFSIIKLVERLQTEADAYLMLEELRWGGAPEACPKCGEVGSCAFIPPSNGRSRATRTGLMSQRRVWRCKGCRKQFSVLTDTVMHGTKIPVRTWVLVIFEVAASKNSVSAWEISRKYGVTNESAWHTLHRLREAMKREPVAGLLSGVVQADETFIGGEPRNRHRSDPREVAKRQAGTTKSDKVAVFSLVHFETREVRSRVVADVTGKTLLPVMRENLDMGNTWLHTDSSSSYFPAEAEVYEHEYVDHSAGQYVGYNAASTNMLEGFFSQLKRSLDGTHHHVSKEHLHRYLAQFDWLYTHCKETDSQRMRHLVGGFEGRRLTYKPLTTRA